MKIKWFLLGVVFAIVLSLVVIGFASGILKTIQVAENSVNININGEKVNAPNYIIEGRTYLQVKDVCGLLNKDLAWDAQTNTIDINDKIILTPNPTNTPIPTIAPILEPTPILNKQIIIYNKTITMNDYPYFENNDYQHPLLPLNVISEGMELNVEKTNGEIILTSLRDTNKLTFIIGEKQMLYNEQRIQMDKAPFELNETIMMPIRYIVEGFGKNFTIDMNTKIIYIDKPEIKRKF